MAKEKFLLVSLSEPKAKELAQAVANETCRKILEYLADNEATETKLSEMLSLPISTVHYNLDLLQQAGLVIAEEFHYSQKGKEVNHYKLANKYIIIAPKSTYGIKERLKNVLPVAFILIVGAGILKIFGNIFGGVSLESSAPKLMAAASPLVRNATEDLAVAAANNAPQLANEMGAVTTNVVPSDIVIWFLAGASAAILLYLLVDYIRNR